MLLNAHAGKRPPLNPDDMKLSVALPGKQVGLVDGSFVYFMWSPDWDLLYIGLTDNPDRRFAEHQRKPWWSDVHHMELEQYPTRARASARERETIAGWDPIYNVARPRAAR